MGFAQKLPKFECTRKEDLNLAFKIAPSLQKTHQAKKDLRQIFEQDLQKQQTEALFIQSFASKILP